MSDLFGTEIVAAPTIIRRASISSCGTYRYRLTRYWGPGYMLPFVMLNPSTADAEVDDPTIRRCMGFARREGAGGIIVVNLYGYRATKPADLLLTDAPQGPENHFALWAACVESIANKMPIVCAWGAHQRGDGIGAIQMFKGEGARLVCLGKTAGGMPRHPLYVRADQPLEPFP